MAQEKKKQFTIPDWRESRTYKSADADTRRLLQQYQNEQGIGKDHMSALLYLEDLRQTPKEEKQRGNRMAEITAIGAMVLFLAAANSRQRIPMLIASLMVIVSAVVYMTGILNPYTVTIRRVKKLLKKNYPEVEPFSKWKASHQHT